MLLDINCTTPITPAMAKLPVMMYAIKNVADDPVTRHVTVFTILRALESLNAHLLTDLGC
jgi:5'-3' exonuclease